MVNSTSPHRLQITRPVNTGNNTCCTLPAVRLSLQRHCTRKPHPCTVLTTVHIHTRPLDVHDTLVYQRPLVTTYGTSDLCRPPRCNLQGPGQASLSRIVSRRILAAVVTLSTTAVETNEDIKDSKLNLFPIQLTVRDTPKKTDNLRAEDPPTYPREHVYNTKAYPSTYTNINTHHGLATHISPHALNSRMTSPHA